MGIPVCFAITINPHIIFLSGWGNNEQKVNVYECMFMSASYETCTFHALSVTQLRERFLTCFVAKKV